jgi:hypothetical protein
MGLSLLVMSKDKKRPGEMNTATRSRTKRGIFFVLFVLIGT